MFSIPLDRCEIKENEQGYLVFGFLIRFYHSC